jgi:hypothetical protein
MARRGRSSYGAHTRGYLCSAKRCSIRRQIASITTLSRFTISVCVRVVRDVAFGGWIKAKQGAKPRLVRVVRDVAFGGWIKAKQGAKPSAVSTVHRTCAAMRAAA